MKLQILSRQIELSFMGTMNSCILELKERDIEAEGIWIRKGQELSGAEVLLDTDTIYIIPKAKQRYDSHAVISYNPPVPIFHQPNVEALFPQNQNRRYLSFSIRLLLGLFIFMQNWQDITLYFVCGLALYLYYCNFNIIVQNRQPTSRLSSWYNVTLSFFGTLIPGLMEIDPGRLLMEMQNAQQAADQAQGLLD